MLQQCQTPWIKPEILCNYMLIIWFKIHCGSEHRQKYVMAVFACFCRASMTRWHNEDDLQPKHIFKVIVILTLSQHYPETLHSPEWVWCHSDTYLWPSVGYFLAFHITRISLKMVQHTFIIPIIILNEIELKVILTVFNIIKLVEISIPV